MNEETNCGITFKCGDGSDYDSGKHGQRRAGRRRFGDKCCPTGNCKRRLYECVWR
ncbi:Uncharacterised protein [uncultured Clostridium sp.]|nr:Uncharacterised protein [uncultured Clostridium sp.]